MGSEARVRASMSEKKPPFGERLSGPAALKRLRVEMDGIVKVHDVLDRSFASEERHNNQEEDQ